MHLWIFLSLVQGGVVNLKIYLGKSENELLVLNTLVFPYIFLLFDCFEWALIDRIVKCKVHSVLWHFQVGGVHLKLYLGKSENELLVLNTLVFPYIFLLFDCFEWVLIDSIVKCKVHSVLWQFQAGGVHLKIYLGKSENELLVLNTLVFPYIFLLFDCFEWVLIDSIVKCKVHLVLCQFPGGWVNLKMSSWISIHWYFLIYSYYLTVSNGHSLTALSSVKFTQCSGTFKWGGQGWVNLKIYPGKSENELLVLNTLVFPYIFLLFDCFKWALIDSIVKCKVHSVLWQFWGGKSEDLPG